MSGDDPHQSFPTQAENVYVSIKSDIMSLRLRPGSMIYEDAVAEQMGVSRTPVREALRRLSWEGLVKCLPKRGSIVSGISINDLREIAQARLIVEPAAARLAAARMPQEEIDRLPEIATPGQGSTGPEADGYQELHRSIARWCGNSRLESFINSLLDDTSRARSMIEDGHLSTETPYHPSIIRALQARDGEAAEEAMRTHVLAMRLFAFVLGK